MPKRKAPGPTGIVKEYFINEPANGRLVKCIYVLINMAYCWGIVPSSWKTAYIHPVPTKENLSLIGNYSPISLSGSKRKV